jgi:hypothetical protein
MSRTEIWRSTTRIAATPVSQLDPFLPDHWQAARHAPAVDQTPAVDQAPIAAAN